MTLQTRTAVTVDITSALSASSLTQVHAPPSAPSCPHTPHRVSVPSIVT